MAARALIVAIEKYPKSTSLAQTIGGATASGEQFFEWVTTRKGIAAQNVFVCADGGSFPAATQFSTAREAIVDALVALVAAGQDQTDELFVYLSGHGYCFQESPEKRAIDVLVASDFETAAASGTKCIKLQEAQEKLYAILGGQHHYYFVDACRTVIREDEIDPIALGRKLGRPAQRGRPTKYTLHSTKFGEPAAIKSDFSPALLDGLGGRGRAKGTTPAGHLWVQFPLLCTYVQERMRTQKTDRNQDGTGGGLIIEIAPIPTYRCAIKVKGAAPTDAFEARLSVAGNAGLTGVTPFQGPAFTLSFSPGNLELGVYESGQPLTRVDPPPSTLLDFFDDCAAAFERNASAGGAPPPPTASISVAAMADVQAINLNTGTVCELGAGRTEDLLAGDYLLTTHERGMTISRDLRTLEPGTEIRIGDEPLDPVRDSIVRTLEGAPIAGVFSFSESLSAMSNRDVGLWLTLMGAAHIVRDPRQFSKLKKVALDDVTLCGANSTAVYVLGTFPGDTPLAIAVGSARQIARPVPNLTGVFQATQPATPGFQLVTIVLGDREARTFASYCLPNHITFIVLSPGSRGQLRANQFLLPMYHLHRGQQPTPSNRLSGAPRPLRFIRTACLFQREFAGSRAISPGESEDREVWTELLRGSWVDPVMSLLACYETLRHGNDADKREVRDKVVSNLDRYFPGIPDTAAIATMLGTPRPRPADAPLFRDGLLAFPEWEDHLPIGAAKLDFNYIWTTWRAGRA